MAGEWPAVKPMARLTAAILHDAECIGVAEAA